MPRGLRRTDANNSDTLGQCYRAGFVVNEPLEFGTEIDLPHEFGNVPPFDEGNVITFTVNPSHFGNIVLLGSTPPPSDVQLIAHTGATNNNSFAGTITTLGINTTGADFIVIAASCKQDTFGTLFVVDNMGNTFAAAETQSEGVGAGVIVTNQLRYCFGLPNVGINHTFTVLNSAGSGNADCAIAVAVFSGMATTDQLESGGFVGGFTTTQSIQGSPITPATAGDLIVQAFMDAGVSLGATVSIDSGFTIPDQNGINTGTGGAGAALAYLITASPVPVNPTWSWSTGFGATLGIVGSPFAQA